MVSMNREHLTERLCLIAPRSLAWITEELPPVGPHDVLVQTRAGAISIGSELPLYSGTSRAGHPPQYPWRMGYESVGIVVACGSTMQRLQRGDRVVAFYGHCTHAVVPETRVIVVPDGISDALAILSILTCDASKGVRKIAPRPEETTLITGAGAIGLLTLFILRAYGVAQIDVVEPLAERHSLARLIRSTECLASTGCTPREHSICRGFRVFQPERGIYSLTEAGSAARAHLHHCRWEYRAACSNL